ncbi:hypothetical protein T4D_2927 [Trichinella pseudospiralis]|uniref:Uncharacterized protein n=1 Tax=Trichinella pseudospiralis TaxID=6337 RepID=A0A0V1FMQ0_TRIPS|nr:hypothetical protein T4D_2927 [Trichinella pseudospiralis]
MQNQKKKLQKVYLKQQFESATVRRCVFVHIHLNFEYCDWFVVVIALKAFSLKPEYGKCI